MLKHQLVPREVSLAKLDRDLQHWTENPAIYRKRGWFLLRRDGLQLDVGFAARVQETSTVAPLPIVAVCARLDYENYDLWPPSVRFVDFFSGEPCIPHVRAPVFTGAQTSTDLFVNSHPDTKQPFLCVPGIREYHDHPQHSGDSWLLHRERHAGAVDTVCDLIWRHMARNVLGVRVTVQTFPPPVGPQADVRLLQGDVDGLQAQVAAATQNLKTAGRR